MDQETKEMIAMLVEEGSNTKMGIGRTYGVSARTVGRYHEQWKARREEKAERPHYSYVITPDIGFITRAHESMINEVVIEDEWH